MEKLRDYYGKKINRLCEAVINFNEELVDKLLADENFDEINEGVSPLYYIGYNLDRDNIDNETRDKILRIFRKILNNERFTNVNTVFYDGHYSSTLLYHLLYKDNPVFEECCIELIKSPKYQLIDYPGNSNHSDLHTAINLGKKVAAKAIMDHSDFTKIDFSFGDEFVKECKELYEKKLRKLYENATIDEKERELFNHLQVIMDEYLLRSGDSKDYNATNTDIAKRLTNSIQFLRKYIEENNHLTFSPLDAAALSARRNGKESFIFEIVNHPKFTGEMLLKYIYNLSLVMSDSEAYYFFKNNRKIEGGTPEFYSELCCNLISSKKIGVLKALLENDNIYLTEQFYSFYDYYLRNALMAYEIGRETLPGPGRFGCTATDVCAIIEDKAEKQYYSKRFVTSKFIDLSKEDYFILQCGMAFYFDLVHKNTNYDPSQQNPIEKKLGELLEYDYDNEKTGPFFNTFDYYKVWKLFSSYEEFEKYREMISSSISIKKQKKA